MEEKEVLKVVKVLEDMYKYYHGWHFDYVYPGYFAYHQMGGDLSVYFTPDFNEDGKVSIQIHNSEGEVISSEEVPYVVPEQNGDPNAKAGAYTLFRIVKPFLDANMNS